MTYRFGIAVALVGTLVGSLGSIGGALGDERVRRVGILAVDPTARTWFEPFFQVLRDAGWIEGKNVVFERRWSEGDPTRYAALARELVQLKLDVIFPVGPPAVRAVFDATKTIPIVAHDLETDPVAAGYANSYSRPGRNLTGLFLDMPELAGKRLELLKAFAPGASNAAVLWDPSSGSAHLSALKAVAPRFGVELLVEEVRNPADFDRFVTGFRPPSQAVIVLPSPMIYMESKRLAELVMKHRIPATSMFRPFAEAGGLFAYGPEMPPTAARCAALLAKVLAGAEPGELPIERPMKFEFVVNLKSAKALGMKIPESILLRADEVIK